MTRVIAWFSRGAASAVATKLIPDAIPVHCATHAEHSDNDRFEADCAAWFRRSIVTLQSDTYADTWDVWERRRYLAGIDGAPCTVELKVGPRLAFQRPDDEHVFGYTADADDVRRAERFRSTYPEVRFRTPLIERGLTKAACLAILDRAGLVPPITYELGLPNANCLPCPKATSSAYWALIRKHFPHKFERMAKLSRELDVRLARFAGQRIFIDEIPLDYPTGNAIAPACDFLCAIAEQEIEGGNEPAAGGLKK